MTTLAAGSSVTVAVRDGGTVAIATNGGLASAVVSPTEGGSIPVSLGPLSERRTLGPYGEGASIVITNSSCGAFDYDVETRNDPSSVAITGGSSRGVSSVAVTANLQSAATANTAAIQAALAAGRPVFLDAANGVIYTNGTIAVPDNLSLKTAPGTVLSQADNTNLPMVVTAAYQSTPASVTVTWSAGGVVSIAWPNHGCVENDAFVLQGGTPAASWDDIYRVASVVDANTITARLPFIPTASPGGTVTAVRCTRNIDVDVTLDYNFNGNQAGAGQNRMASIFAFVADSKVRVVGKNAYKYVCLVSGFYNVDVDARGYPNSRSDTLKLYGPGNDVRAKVQGQASEDCGSVQCLEPAAFIAYMPSKGNIRNVKFFDPAAYTTTAGSAAMVVYGDNVYTISGVVIEGGNIAQVGATGTASALKIVGGVGFTTTTANIEDVTVQRTRLSSAVADTIAPATPLRKLHLRSCRFDVPGTDSNRLLYCPVQADTILVEDTEFELSNWSSSTTQFAFHFPAGGAVRNLIFKKCQIKGISTLRFLVIFGSVQTVIFEDCDVSTIDVLCRLETTATGSPTPEVIIRGGNYASCNTITNWRASGKLRLEGPNIAGAINGVARGEGASTVVDVIGDAVLTTPSQLWTGLTSAQVNLKTPQMVFDIGATGVKKSAGNECINGASTRGTITTGLPVICDGTNWASKTNLSLTF